MSTLNICFHGQNKKSINSFLDEKSALSRAMRYLHPVFENFHSIFKNTATFLVPYS